MADVFAQTTTSVAKQVSDEKAFVVALADELFRQARALNFAPQTWHDDLRTPLDGLPAEIVVLVAHNLAGRLARAVGRSGTEPDGGGVVGRSDWVAPLLGHTAT